MFPRISPPTTQIIQGRQFSKLKIDKQPTNRYLMIEEFESDCDSFVH